MTKQERQKRQRMEALLAVIRIAGGRDKLAAKIGINGEAISHWKTRGYAPASRCLALEQSCQGQVSRCDLRPDIFGEPVRAKKARKAS